MDTSKNIEKMRFYPVITAHTAICVPINLEDEWQLKLVYSTCEHILYRYICICSNILRHMYMYIHTQIHIDVEK